MLVAGMFPEERAGAEMSWAGETQARRAIKKAPEFCAAGEEATKLRDLVLACVRLLSTTDQLTTD
jgi:hypothetical protein